MTDAVSDASDASAELVLVTIASLDKRLRNTAKARWCLCVLSSVFVLAFVGFAVFYTVAWRPTVVEQTRRALPGATPVAVGTSGEACVLTITHTTVEHKTATVIGALCSKDVMRVVDVTVRPTVGRLLEPGPGLACEAGVDCVTPVGALVIVGGVFFVLCTFGMCVLWWHRARLLTKRARLHADASDAGSVEMT